jgi:sRNA-binding carbon storage regulator CsrA
MLVITRKDREGIAIFDRNGEWVCDVIYSRSSDRNNCLCIDAPKENCFIARKENVSTPETIANLTKFIDLRKLNGL